MNDEFQMPDSQFNTSESEGSPDTYNQQTPRNLAISMQAAYLLKMKTDNGMKTIKWICNKGGRM